MKRKQFHFGFTITELIMAIAIGALLVLTIGIVMVDSQRGWLDSYAKVHGGATSEAVMAKTAFDRVVRKASRSIYNLNGLDDITVFYYQNWLTSTELDRYARFYRSEDDPSQMYIQHGEMSGGVKSSVLADVLLASNVVDLTFLPVSGGLQMELALDDGREETTVMTTALLHNE